MHAARSMNVAACTASVKTRAVSLRARTTSTTSASGCTTPVSLLASMTATTAVVSSICPANCSTSTTPLWSTSNSLQRTPGVRAAARHDSRTAGCSTAALSTDTPPPPAPPPDRTAPTVPDTARLADSVPPEVKTMSRGSRPSAAATSSRDSSSRRRARCAGRWLPVGLPSGTDRASAMASATSERSGVVAPWSRYVVTSSLM